MPHRLGWVGASRGGVPRLLPLVLAGAILALASTGCGPRPGPTPPSSTGEPVVSLGPHSFIHYGTTVDQNVFSVLATDQCPKDDLDQPTQRRGPPGQPHAPDPELNVLALMVDVWDFPFSGTAAERTTHHDAKLTEYRDNTDAFWREASYGTVSAVTWAMPDRILRMKGAFNDYFNRTFAEASLTTKGLSATLPLELDGSAAVTIHVRDAADRNRDVVFAPIGTFANVAALVPACQTVFNAVASVPANWVTCSASGPELRVTLRRDATNEGAFLRVKEGSELVALGFSGPIEAPGDGAIRASMSGLAATYPITTTTADSLQFEVRAQDLRTRRYTVGFTAGSLANPAALAAIVLPIVNGEFPWVESFDLGSNRFGLRIAEDFNGARAAVRVISGTNRAKFGLDGPTRIDGVVTESATNTVRGNRATTVGEALSLHIAAEAAASAIAISAANEGALDALVTTHLANIESYMVLFIDDHTGIPNRRAGAGKGPFNIRIPGAGGYVYENQVNSTLQIGSSAAGWATWAHELGHNLDMWDIYPKPGYDAAYSLDWDYLKVWSLMHDHTGENHPDGWHKYNRGWLGTAQDILPPPAAGTETTRFTLTPLEFPFTDYPAVGTAASPARHLARIQLSPEHWLLLENRQPAPNYSQNLPDDHAGQVPTTVGSAAGGLLITDTVNPWSQFLYRSAVTTLNPDGMPGGTFRAARALKAGDVFDPMTAFPAYDGIEIRVTESVAGPAGKPEALRVEVERGPGDFLDLRIRPWHAPDTYGTPDIWVDWPGDGEEDYSAVDPPVGNGDDTHWHPDGSVTNNIRVRVHNDGTIVARDVVIRAYINEPMGMGDRGTFVAMPDSAPSDIPAGGFHDFAFPWNPTSRGHTCLQAEVLSHTSTLGELDLSNNRAQENVNDFHPQAGSPFTPVEFEFSVNSDFTIPIEVEFHASGLPPGMDLELESQWITLAPDENRTLRGRLFVDHTVISPQPEAKQRCRYRFNLHAFIRTQDYMLPFGGITVNVTPTRASSLKLRGVRPAEAPGAKSAARVEGELVGAWPDFQQVDAIIVSDVDKVTYSGTAVTNSTGHFSLVVPGVPQGTGRLMLYYFGKNLAPSTLGPVPVQF